MRRSASVVALLICLSTAWSQPSVVTTDSPLDGRVLTVSNGLVQASVAPQLGGRMLDLRRCGGEEIVKSDADYTQTTEQLWAKEGRAGLSWSPAEGFLGADGEMAAVRWSAECRLGKQSARVERELVVASDRPAVYLRVRVTNLSAETLHEVGYCIAPHVPAREGTTLRATSEMDLATLSDPQTDVETEVGELVTPGTTVSFDFRDATYRIRGERYMFRIEHALGLGDIAPGECGESLGAWWLLPPATQEERAPLDWEALPELAAVEPLIVSDAPPEDLPRTPGADGYFGLCAGNTALADLPLWQAAGVKWARLSFAWSEGEKQRGRYDFSEMDDRVRAAEAAGLRVIGLLLCNPGWATLDGGALSPPRDYGDLERYAEALASRYRGQVDVWEVWNEPDIDQFWKGSADEYAAYLKAVYTGAKRGNPDCYVMSAGLDGPGERYLDRLAQSGALQYSDLVGFHPYSGTPAGAERRIRAVWRILNFHGLRKPVWVTEVGWQSGGWAAGPGVTDGEETKAKYLQEAYERLRPLCEVVCWYVDIEAGAMFGLARPEGAGLALTPAYAAYRRASAADRREPWRVSGPAEATAKAGETTTLDLVLRNQSDAPARPRVAIAPALPWLSVEAPEGPVAEGAEVPVRLVARPPVWMVPRALQVHVVSTVEGGGGTVAPLVLTVTNDGPSCAVQIERRWAIRVDENGKTVGDWTPTDSLLTAPGDRLRQEVRVWNRGTADGTFRVELSGPAAAWAEGFPREEAIKAGGEMWLGIVLRVPADAQAGTHELVLCVSSVQFPEVRESMGYGIGVGRAGR